MILDKEFKISGISYIIEQESDTFRLAKIATSVRKTKRKTIESKSSSTEIRSPHQETIKLYLLGAFNGHYVKEIEEIFECQST